MKLTTTIRDAFIRAALNDVPTVDYRSQAAKLVREDSISRLPPKIRALATNVETEHFLRQETFYDTPDGLGTITIYCGRGDRYRPGAEVMLKLRELGEKCKEQDAKLKSLRESLKAVAYSCTTRKTLAEKLPEFEKYLPANEAAACKTLPAVANVVSDFVKAGWPKTGDPAGVAVASTKKK